ncbi:MAG: competence/damage-inducible protein A [Cytophagales bacterium]|nr:competence/damage-inducible protein A [Cytophagales bacterium]
MKSILAEILTIGDEILYGQITDTNSQFIGEELWKIGVRVIRRTSVGDNETEILYALHDAHRRADIILITGGLGPTKDDITKKTLCKYFNTSLRTDEKVLAMVTEFFTKRGRELTELNRLQATVPQNATVLYNLWGTAPAMWFEYEGKVYVSMPGVPLEMKNLMKHEVLPRLKNHFQLPVIYHKVICTYGAGESMLAQTIAEWEDALPKHIKLAYLPNWGELRLRLTAFGEDLSKLETEVAQEIEKVLPLIRKYVFGYDNDEMHAVVGRLLKSQNKTLSCAESCTGGYFAHLITSVAGSSYYFKGGVVAYTNQVKIQQLGIEPETLETHTAVSEVVAKQMAIQIRKKMNTDIGIACTGYAGPDGGTPDAPIGTIWVAYADETEAYAKKLFFTQDRQLNIQLTAKVMLDLVRRKLSGIS